MSRPLVISPCRSACAWAPTRSVRDGERLFACTGCGSQWVPSEPWTPVDHTGVVPAAVQEARRTRGGGWQRGQK